MVVAAAAAAAVAAVGIPISCQGTLPVTSWMVITPTAGEHAQHGYHTRYIMHLSSHRYIAHICMGKYMVLVVSWLPFARIVANQNSKNILQHSQGESRHLYIIETQKAPHPPPLVASSWPITHQHKDRSVGCGFHPWLPVTYIGMSHTDE